MPAANPPGTSFTASCGAYIGQEGGCGDPGGLPCGHLQGRLPGSPSPVCFPHAWQTHFLQKLYSVLALVQVATIEYHRLVGLSNRFISHGYGGWKFNIREPAWLGFWVSQMQEIKVY